MRKQITSLLLTLAMLLSLVPTLGVTASAAEDDTSYSQAEIRDYATFASYLRSYDSRDLKLMEDIDYTVGINDLSIDVMCNQKLDLNGHKIRIDASKRGLKTCSAFAAANSRCMTARAAANSRFPFLMTTKRTASS